MSSSDVESGWDLEEEFAVQDQESDGIEWSDPPRVRGSKASADTYLPVAKALRSRPGQWAKIASGTKNTSLVAQINQGKISAFSPAQSFKATGRSNPEGGTDVWARFVGE